MSEAASLAAAADTLSQNTRGHILRVSECRQVKHFAILSKKQIDNCFSEADHLDLLAVPCCVSQDWTCLMNRFNNCSGSVDRMKYNPKKRPAS